MSSYAAWANRAVFLEQKNVEHTLGGFDRQARQAKIFERSHFPPIFRRNCRLAKKSTKMGSKN